MRLSTSHAGAIAEVVVPESCMERLEKDGDLWSAAGFMLENG